MVKSSAAFPGRVAASSRRAGRAVPDNQQSAARHFGHYSIARYLSEFLFLVRGFALARLLGPALFGIWIQMKIVLLFLQYAQLGAHEAMLREVPFALGQGERERARRIERVVLAFNLATSAVITGALVAAISVWSRGQPAALRWAWLALAAVYPLSQLYWYLHLKLRAEKRFARVSRIMIGFALLSTVAGVLAAMRYGIQGFLVALALSFSLILGLAEPGRSPLPRPLWDWRTARKLLGTGFPIMASGALLILLWNVDKLAIWWLMPRADLGIYALVAYLLSSILMLPEAVAVVMYPRFVERVARAKSRSALEQHLMRPTLIVGYLTCPILGALFLSLHWLLRWLLPDYLPALAPGRILIAFAFLMAVARVPSVMLVALNRQKMLMALTLMSVCVGAVAVIGLIWMGLGLVGAAWGAAASFFVYFALTIATCFKALQAPPGRLASFLSALVLPYVVQTAAVAAVLVALPTAADGFGADLTRTALKVVLALAVGGALFWRAKDRFHLLEPVAGAAPT